MTNEMMNTHNENMMVSMEDNSFIGELTSRQTTFCSFEPKNEEEQARLFKAMNNPDERIGDHINEVIEVTDVFCEVVQCVHKETGEMNTCPRIVLFTKEGKTYQAVSLGVFSAIKKVFQCFGMPPFAKPLPLKVLQVTKGEKKMLTFDVVFKK